MKRIFSNFERILPLFFAFGVLILFFSLKPFSQKPLKAQSDINWCALPDSVVSGSGGINNPSNVKDGNEDSWYGDEALCPSSDSFNYWVQITFSQPARINRVEILHEAYAGFEYPEVGDAYAEWTVYLYYNGSWHEVLSGEVVAPESEGKVTDSNNTGWNNVTAIKVVASGGCVSLDPYGAGAGHRTFELRAWGPPPTPPYIDCGLRINTPKGVIAIACEPAGTLTSPLRIKKSDGIYGIVLVDPSDPDASPIRIKTSSGIKALRKY